MSHPVENHEYRFSHFASYSIKATDADCKPIKVLNSVNNRNSVGGQVIEINMGAQLQFYLGVLLFSSLVCMTISSEVI